MSESLTIDRKEFRKLMNRINTIEEFVKEVKSNKMPRKWISEEDVMSLTGLGKSSLRKKRSRGVFTYSTATGRKIQYLKKEIEDYLNDHATK
jgi:predicted DNA-binding transcriptional regulator AlpA